MGLINRFTDSARDPKHIMAPWRRSLEKAKVLTWGLLHDIALQKVKDVITNPEGPVLKNFETEVIRSTYRESNTLGNNKRNLEEDRQSTENLRNANNTLRSK